MEIELYDSELNRIISRPKWLANIILSANHIKDGRRFCLKSEMSEYVHFAPQTAKRVEDQPKDATRRRTRTNVNENPEQ